MASRFTHFPNSVVLTASSSRSLRQSLTDFRMCAEAEYAGLLEESGTVLMENGTLPADQSDIVGALANGAFIAVRELASRLGDDCCEGLYHQGRTKHFSIVPLSPVTTLITVFGNETKLGIVRSATARYGPQLRDLLADSALAPPSSPEQEGDLVLEAYPREEAPPAVGHTPLPPLTFHEMPPVMPVMPVVPIVPAPPSFTNAPPMFSPFLPVPPLHSADPSTS